jgi:hypothetical protein
LYKYSFSDGKISLKKGWGYFVVGSKPIHRLAMSFVDLNNQRMIIILLYNIERIIECAARHFTKAYTKKALFESCLIFFTVPSNIFCLCLQALYDRKFLLPAPPMRAEYDGSAIRASS